MKQSKLASKTVKAISEQETSINAQYLERAGYISKLMAGVYSFEVLGLRVLTNIENIIRKHMNAVGGQEILMPALQPSEPWKITDRWDSVDVLFKFKGAGDRDLCLGPTHEEIVTPLIGKHIQSYKDLPVSVYQIQTKFRNELRAKSGLLRGREFRMKDLYSFHATQEDLDAYYETIKDAYFGIFNDCGLGDLTYLTYASGGIFAKYSHEFQTITPFGEDIVFVCSACDIAVNKEIIEDQKGCPACGNAQLEEQKAIEVGNIFKLGTRFSKPFNVKYLDDKGQSQDVVMGCYGLGSSRLMAAIVEISHDDKGIIWPAKVAPFDVHLLQFSKEPEVVAQSQDLYQKLQYRGFDVLYDDREDISPGQKMMDSDLIGIPVRVVISPRSLKNQHVEVKRRNEKEAQLISPEAVFEYLCK